MTKNRPTLGLLALAVLSGPVWAYQPAQLVPPAESAISLMPSAVAPNMPQAVVHIPGEASLSILPAMAAPQTAASADVSAMLAQPAAPTNDQIGKMDSTQAQSAGEDMMDRILYIKGTPRTESSASVVAPNSSMGSVTLKPARRGPLYYALAGPAKIATSSTEFISKKTRIPPFWTAMGMSALNIIGTMRAILGPTWDLPMPGSHMSGGAIAAFVGTTLMALMYLGHASWWMKEDAERETAEKFSKAVFKGQRELHEAGFSVEGKTMPGKNGNERVIVIGVKQIDATNINKIPQSIDGFKVQVQFVR